MGITLETEAFVALQRAANGLMEDITRLLKGYGLSPAQFNALRILRGARPASLTCGEVGDRLITRGPDVTRLLERMEKGGLVSRVRGTEDRRVVRVTISERGLDLLAQLDEPVTELHRKQFSALRERRTASLVKLASALLASRTAPDASKM
ncbi:MarR family winged helix-turn-helix transcriptional regulator [Paludibaculum fermentans]|uniref:MarR family transcriptional regulator n=1 Tax=Paludibaculum fermentans TaxID=1473598 RepID=A0A7S7NJP6_PALFE|nr:MarR family transcriptional regulator [Paludibaculum fermentans]QOY84886.1 MarR family transcriptional regulator [Paludibaculum fermentans]